MSFYTRRTNGYGRGEAIVDLQVPAQSLGQQIMGQTMVPLVHSADVVRKTTAPTMATTMIDPAWTGETFKPTLGQRILQVLGQPIVGPVVVWHALAAAGLAGAGYYAYRRSHR